MTRRQGPRLTVAVIVAAFTALAGLTGLVGQAVFLRTEAWRTQLAGEMTVALRPGPNADANAIRAAEVLAGTAGVAEARALEPSRVGALLTPWTAGARGPDLALLPRLIAVDLDPQRPARREALADALSGAGIDAVVDDHKRWLRSALELRNGLAAPLIGALTVCVAGLAAAGGLAASYRANQLRSGIRIRLELGASQLSCIVLIGDAAIDVTVGVLAGGLIAAALARLSALAAGEAASGTLWVQVGLLAALIAAAQVVALISAFVTAARRVRELAP